MQVLGAKIFTIRKNNIGLFNGIEERRTPDSHFFYSQEILSQISFQMVENRHVQGL